MSRIVTVWRDGRASCSSAPRDLTTEVLGEQLEWRVEAMATCIGAAESEGPDAVALAEEARRRLAKLEAVARAAREVVTKTASLPTSWTEIIHAEAWDALDAALADLDALAETPQVAQGHKGADGRKGGGE